MSARDIKRAAQIWALGFDTSYIAETLRVPEWLVASHIEKIRAWRPF